MATLFGLTLIVAVTGQLPTDNLPMSPPFSDDAAVRLAYMKPQARLRQLRAMAEEFSATDDFLAAGWSQLRLLPKPWLRYGNARSGVEDGALFAFAIGTDPEVFLMIESRSDPAGVLRWEYALAPMTSFEVKVSWKGNQVWTLPHRKDSFDPTEPFYDMYYSAQPH
jgi:hypothetical protein